MKSIALLSHVTQGLRVVVVSLFAAALSACGGGGSNAEPVAVMDQAAPAPSSGASEPSSDPIPVSWAKPTGGPARVFDYAGAAAPVADYTRASRFVLYDSGTFQLQLVDPSSGSIMVYAGRYAEAGAVVTFAWDGFSTAGPDGSSTAGPWGATGTLDGKSLTVQYNLNMWLSDFENAVYVLAP
jgi:hypothetical protein